MRGRDGEEADGEKKGSKEVTDGEEMAGEGTADREEGIEER